MSIRPAHGGVQFHDMISQGNHQSPAAAPDSPANPMPGPTSGHSDEVPMSNQNRQGQESLSARLPSPRNDQPDQEPEVPSISSSTPNNQIDSPEVVDTPAHEIPVPDTSDDGESLYTHEEPCFHLQEDQMYRFEIDIMQKDINNWREETRPKEMAFLVSAAKRQRSEVKISTLGAHDRKLFEEAKTKEVDSWLSTSTVCRSTKCPLRISCVAVGFSHGKMLTSPECLPLHNHRAERPKRALWFLGLKTRW